MTVLFLILVGSLAWMYEQQRTLPEGTFFADLHLEGLNRTEALAVIQTEVDRYRNRVFSITANDLGSYHFKPQELGVEYSAEYSVAEVFSGTSWYNTVLASAIGSEEKKEFTPHYDVHQEFLESTVSGLLTALNNQPVDASIIWSEEQWQVSPEQVGKQLKEGESKKIAESIFSQLPLYEQQVVFEAQYSQLEPSRKAEQISPLHQQLSELNEQEMTLKYQQDEIVLLLKENPDWIQLNQDFSAYEWNQEALKTTIAQLANQYDLEPSQVVLTGVEEVVSEYDGQIYKKAVLEGDFRRGRKLDQEELLTQLNQALNTLLEQQNPSLELKYQTLYSTVSSLVPEYQFPQNLSTGVSSYYLGNHPDRVKNIELSLNPFKGVIIEPGEEMSFNRVTGWVTPSKGYRTTKIISAGKVEEGVGGGVCQSSTTVYRGVLNAGLNVTERRNHTLDVSYYHAYGYGLDATVYTDARSDFKFVNDFPGPIMMNAFIDPATQLAHVEFYGQTDHRTVELTNVPTGNLLLKKWNWKVIWPDREEERQVVSRYQLPKEDEEEEEEEANPLEA